MARAFDHHLDIVLPGLPGQFAQRLQFGELRGIAGVGEAAGTQAVAQREADVVLLEDLADLVEVLVEQVLLVVLHHPFGQNRAAAADDAGDALRGQRDVLHQHAGMDGHVIHALLGLLFDHFEHHVDVQIFHAAHARERFVDRHGADGHGRVGDDGFADARDVAAGGEIHHGVGAVLHRVLQLLQFFVDIGGGGRVADVGVDLALGGHADAIGSRLVWWMLAGMIIRPRATSERTVSGGKLFAPGDILHLAGDHALAGVMHLGPDRVRHSGGNPLTAHN